MDKLISIIVPVYNVEEYLERCLASLQNQSYKNIEVIMIDDCSTDNSVKIARNFVDTDGRFKMISLDCNCGAAVARERGLQSANGNYIMFVDSDDWAHKDYCKIMVEKIESSDSDIVQCSHITSSQDNEKDTQISDVRQNVYDSLEAIKQLYGESEKSEFNFLLWNKIYKKEVWDGMPHMMEKLKINDVPYIPIAFSKAKKIAVNNAKLYYYYQRNSLENKSTMDENKSNYFCMAYEHFRAFRVISDYFELINKELYILTMKYTLVYALSVLKANHDRATKIEAIEKIKNADSSALQFLPLKKRVVCACIRALCG